MRQVVGCAKRLIFALIEFLIITRGLPTELWQKSRQQVTESHRDRLNEGTDRPSSASVPTG